MKMGSLILSIFLVSLITRADDSNINAAYERGITDGIKAAQLLTAQDGSADGLLERCLAYYYLPLPSYTTAQKGQGYQVGFNFGRKWERKSNAIYFIAYANAYSSTTALDCEKSEKFVAIRDSAEQSL